MSLKTIIGGSTATVAAAVIDRGAISEAVTGLHRQVDRLRTPAERDEFLSEVAAIQETVASLLAAPPAELNEAAAALSTDSGAVKAMGCELASSLRRVSLLAERARVRAPADQDVHVLGEQATSFQERRSHHSRREHCSHEGMARARAELAAGLTEGTQPPSAPSPGLTDARVRELDRTRGFQEAAASRQASRVRAVAEVVYAAIPFDAEEKAAHRTVVIEQMESLVAGADGPGNELLQELFDQVDAIPDVTPDLVSEAAADRESPLGSLLEGIASVAEGRVVDAFNASQRASKALAAAITEATESSGEDAELARTRVLRLERDAVPSLMESLFLANTRILAEESGGAVPAGAVLTESVAQYTALETLNSLKVLVVEDAETLARMISRLRAPQ